VFALSKFASKNLSPTLPPLLPIPDLASLAFGRGLLRFPPTTPDIPPALSQAAAFVPLVRPPFSQDRHFIMVHFYLESLYFCTFIYITSILPLA
jgi:hypothetical protein